MSICRFRFSIPLHYQILIMLLAGGLFGYFFSGLTVYTNWIGEIFLRGLNMIIVPLIFCSITTGVASVGSSGNLGRLGIKTIGYYMLSSLAAVSTGLIFVNLVKPGIGADIGLIETVEGISALSDNFGQTLIKIIPTNIVDALAQGQMLSIIFFAILFGFFLTRIGEKHSQLLIDFLDGVLEVIMKITMLIIRLTPLGVFSITSKVIAQQVITGQGISDIIARLGMYMATVLTGLIFHFFITLPLAMKLISKVNPVRHIRNMATPLLTAFSTSSSNATLPLSMEAVENNNGVSNKIVSFTMPLGATINMDGTALYECVAAMFIAQAYGIDLTIVQQITIVITSLLASIGAAGIPMAGLVMLAVVLKTAGLPLEGIGLLLAVDRILDMFRTTVNVYSDTICAVIIAKSEGEKLKI